MTTTLDDQPSRSPFDMPFLNEWKPSPPPARSLNPHKDTPIDRYDVNFNLGPVDELRSDKVLVTPFVPSLHAQLYLDGTKEDEAHIFRWLPWGPWESLSHLLQFLEEVRQEPGHILYAVFDLTRSEPAFAGVFNYYLSSPRTLTTEIGHAIVLPAFRRTHVLSHAVGLLLQNAFDMLHCRRVQWTACAQNLQSVASAERMGFLREGLIKNSLEFPGSKEGDAFATERDREGEPSLSTPVVSWEGRDRTTRGVAVDIILLGISREEWERNGRKVVEKQMARLA